MDSPFCFHRFLNSSRNIGMCMFFVLFGMNVNAQINVVNFSPGTDNALINFCLDNHGNPYLAFENKSPNQSKKIFLAKLNDQLQFEWSRLLSIHNLDIIVKNLIDLPNGNVMVIAEDNWKDEKFENPNIVLAEFEQNGNLLYVTRTGSEKFEELTSAITLADGRVIFTGNIQNKTNYNLLFLEWKDGDFIKQKAIQIGKRDYISGLVEHKGSLYAYGRFVNDGPVIKAFIAKMNLDLEVQKIWSFSDSHNMQYPYENNTIQHVRSDSDGLFVVFGRDWSIVNFHFSEGIITRQGIQEAELKITNSTIFDGRQYLFYSEYGRMTIDNDSIVYLNESGGVNRIDFHQDAFTFLHVGGDHYTMTKGTLKNLNICSIMTDENFSSSNEVTMHVDSLVVRILDEPGFVFDTLSDVNLEPYSFTIHQECFVSALYDDAVESIQIFPNPTTDIIYFSKKNDYRLFDSNGQLLDKGLNQHVCFLDSYSPGLYFIEISNQWFKVVKL